MASCSLRPIPRTWARYARRARDLPIERIDTMYCPRCERTIKKERLEKLNEELKSRFEKDSLKHGACPVCGTKLIDVTNKKVE